MSKSSHIKSLVRVKYSRSHLASSAGIFSEHFSLKWASCFAIVQWGLRNQIISQQERVKKKKTWDPKPLVKKKAKES